MLALVNTLETTFIGFFIGSVLAFLFAYLTFHFKFLENLFGGIIFFLFSSPLIVIVWIVHGTIPYPNLASYLFVSLVVIFPIYSHVSRGMEETPSAFTDSIFVCGGNNIKASHYARIWSAIPNFAVGLQASWSAAFLAALISDFASGIHPSLGGLLTGMISQGSIDQKLSFILLCTVIGYSGHVILGKFVFYAQKKYASDMPDHLNDVYEKKRANYFKPKWILSKICKYIVWPLLIWYIFAMATPLTLPSKTPSEVMLFFFDSPNSGHNISTLLAAFKVTIWHGAIGLVATLILVYFLTIITLFSKGAGFLIDPILVFFQATPIVAWLGVLRLIEAPLLLAISTSITASVFPAYIFIKNRLISPPKSFLMPIKVFGGGRSHFFWHLQVPLLLASIPEVIAVIAPRIILGVMLAEYFLTNDGLGGMMFQNRVAGNREFWWGILVLVGGVSILFYSLQKLVQDFIVSYIIKPLSSK